MQFSSSKSGVCTYNMCKVPMIGINYECHIILNALQMEQNTFLNIRYTYIIKCNK